jgi:hypothetical protein
VPFLAYLSTLQGRIQYWDTGEMQTVPWIFGIAHPTGFPAFILTAGIFAHLFPLGPVSWRIAFFCAMLMLACVALVYVTIVSITGDRLSAACAGWLLAFGTYFWSYGARAEVHDAAAFCGALALYFALRGFYDENVRRFFAAALALGVGLATHPIVLLTLPSLLLLALARRQLFSLRRAAAAAALLIVPLAFYAYLPLRSHAVVAAGLDPAPALGKPPGGAIWNMQNPQTPGGFARLVTGSDFNAGGSLAKIFDVPAYAGKLRVFAAAMYREFSPVGLLAAGIGFVALVRRRAIVAIALLLCVVLPSAFALAYPPVVEPQRYFFIPMIALALIVGLGITALEPRYRNLLRIPVACAAMALLALSYPDAKLRGGSGAELLIAQVREITPSNAILIADWTRGTALSYAAYVDQSLGDRSIDISWPYQDRRYLTRWLRERPVYYIGRPLLHRGIVLCPRSEDYPIFEVQQAPASCR